MSRRNSTIKTFQPVRQPGVDITSANAQVIDASLGPSLSSNRFANMPKPGVFTPNAGKIETIKFADNGQTIDIVLPQGSSPKVVDDKKMDAIQAALPKGAEKRPIEIENRNPNARLTKNPKLNMVLKGELPALANGTKATVDGARGAIRGENLKLDGQDLDASDTSLHNTSLEINVRNAKLDRAKMSGIVLKTSMMPNAADATIHTAFGSNVDIASGAQLARSTVTGSNIKVHGPQAQEAGRSYVAFSAQAPKTIGSLAVVQHESREALQHAHNPSLALVAALKAEAQEGFSGRRTRNRFPEPSPMGAAA